MFEILLQASDTCVSYYLSLCRYYSMSAERGKLKLAQEFSQTITCR